VSKFWSLLFLLVPILGVAVFVAAPYLNSWLPVDVSEHGRRIDHLFMFILWLTGAVFIATEVVMFWFMWKYSDDSNPEPVKYMHGSHSLEVVWTVLPAATLLFIAIYQMDAWASNKLASNAPDMKPTVEVMGRQFEWRFRYPGPDGDLYTSDDIHDVNVLHLPVKEDVLIVLKSEDVLHSFFLPNLRVKQDSVPGMQIGVWFKSLKEGSYDIVCAELCGWGHYKMKGQVIFEPRTQFEAFLAQKYQEQNETTEPPPAEED